MKKLIVACCLVLLFALPTMAANSMCPLLWDNVAGQTYTINTPDQMFDVVFSPSFVGPCPQGIVEVYDGVYIAPVLECNYMAAGSDKVTVDCGTGEILFLLTGDRLLVIDPDAFYMQRK